MTKTEQYFKEIQKIAINNLSNFNNYVDVIDRFLNSQIILKRNKIKTLEDKIKIYVVEYINNKLEEDFYNRHTTEDLYTFLYNFVSDICLEVKTVAIDSIVVFCLTNKKDKLNSIIIDGYNDKVKKIREYESEIKKLKEGML